MVSKGTSKAKQRPAERDREKKAKARYERAQMSTDLSSSLLASPHIISSHPLSLPLKPKFAHRAKKKAKEDAAAAAAAAAAGGSNSIVRKSRTSSWGSAGGGESEGKKRLFFVDIGSLERMLAYYGYLRCRDALFIFDAERSWVFSGKSGGIRGGADGDGGVSRGVV